jgi:hypothetical protein
MYTQESNPDHQGKLTTEMETEEAKLARRRAEYAILKDALRRGIPAVHIPFLVANVSASVPGHPAYSYMHTDRYGGYGGGYGYGYGYAHLPGGYGYGYRGIYLPYPLSSIIHIQDVVMR